MLVYQLRIRLPLLPDSAVDVLQGCVSQIELPLLSEVHPVYDGVADMDSIDAHPQTLSPIFLAIPSFATAPALIVVGFLMLTSVTKIDFDDLTEAIPAFIAIIAMPFLYSISEGIALGVISYVIINVCTGKAKDKKISPLMYALAVIFVLKYVFL